MPEYKDYGIRPQAGRMIKENGDLFNVADFLQDLYNDDNDLQVDVTDQADRDLGKVDIAGIDSVGTIAGQDTMANSLPVAIASDQSDLPMEYSTMSRGSTQTLLSGVTATTSSSEVDCSGYNRAALECAVSEITSGNWTVEVKGCFVTSGTVGSIYALRGSGWEAQITPELDANGVYIFIIENLPPFVKITGTRTTDGTLTAKLILYNA